MAHRDFHDQAFDDATLTKLNIFEAYVGEWLPVFFANSQTWCQEVHLFDFFAGPGRDQKGVPGSPLRLMKQLDSQSRSSRWSHLPVFAHFFDDDREKILRLKATLQEPGVTPRGVTLDVHPWDFETAWLQRRDLLRRNRSAKLVLIDQSGVRHVTDEIFGRTVQAPEGHE
jgi:three-Cys-motif partner protein